MKNVCDICGGRIINKNGRRRCQSCGIFVPEEITNEEIDLLYHANQQLRLGNFDDAEILFRDITSQFPNNANAFWGLCLSEYGIKYEKDYDGKMIPTCYKASYKSLYDNQNFKNAYNFSDNDEKRYLNEQAEKIEKIRAEWVNVASKEEPYDIFLSYKATELDNDKLRTEDSYEAHELYNELTKMGYKVFFSKEALSEKTGEHFEPYIFNALNTCHVMIVYTSKPEYVNSVWVKNEWTRFLKRIKQKQKLNNSLLLIYKDFNPADLPRPLSNIQNLDRNDIRFGEKLDNYLNRVISEAKKNVPKIESINLKPFEVTNKKLNKIKKKEFNPVVPNIASSSINIQTRGFGSCSSSKLTPNVESSIKIGYGFLRKKLYDDAIKQFNDVLSVDNANGKAIFGKLLSITNCNDFDAFLNSDFSKFNCFSLLQDSITHLEKQESEKILSCLYEKVIKCVRNKEWQSALKLYLQICDYDVDVIQQKHAFLIQEVIKTNDLNNLSIQLIKCSLNFLVKDEKNYQENINQIINSLISLDKFDMAKDIYDEADKYIYDNVEFKKWIFFIETHKKNIR